MRVEVGGHALEVHDGGVGAPTLVLLHGFPLSSAMYDPIRPVIENAGRMVAVDLRGFGASDAPEGRYGMDDLAGDVLRVVDQLGEERVVLGGHSMGGYVALRFAARYVERLAGMVLIDTRAGADSDEAIAKRRDAITTIRDRGRDAFLDGFLPALIGPTSHERQPELVDRMRAMAATIPDHVLIGCLEGMRERPDSRDLLTSLEVPALVIVGAEDAITPPAEAYQLADALPDARVELIDGAGHTPTLERPLEVADALAAFLRGLS
jgi:pimeloyl-ACP methyl ester carboxylesterase